MAQDQHESFASADELQTHTKGQILASDARVDPALAAVSSSIRNHCGWHISPVKLADEIILDGPGGRLLQLPTLKIVSLTAVEEDGTALDVTKIDISSRTGQIERTEGFWTRRYGKIKVTMDHGYEQTPDIKQVVLDIVARGLASPMGATREQAGSLSVNWGMVQPGVSGGIVPLASELNIIEAYKVEVY